jgi:hypothetical protein
MILPTRCLNGAMTELRLPKPIPLGPRMYAIVSAAALGAVTGAPLVKAVLHMGREREMMGITLSTALLSAVLVAFITHQKGKRAPLAAALLAVPLGALNTGLSLAISELMAGNVEQAGSSLVMGTLFGVVFGAPLGLGYALVLALPCYLVTRVRSVAGPGAGLKGRLPLALMLLFASAVVTHPIAIVQDLAIFVALLGFALCLVDVVRWRYFRAALRAGRRADLEAVPLSAYMNSMEAASLPETTWHSVGLAARHGEGDVLLSRSPQSTPFRDMDRAEPVAVIGAWGGEVVCAGDAQPASGG